MERTVDNMQINLHRAKRNVEEAAILNEEMRDEQVAINKLTDLFAKDFAKVKELVAKLVGDTNDN